MVVAGVVVVNSVVVDSVAWACSGAVPILAWRSGSRPGGGGAVPISAWRRGSQPGGGGVVLISAWRCGSLSRGGGVVPDLGFFFFLIL